MSKQRQHVTSIVYDKSGRVLAIGQNSYVRTRKMQVFHAWKVGKPEKTMVHAEIDALSKVKDLRKAHRIAVTRLLKDGSTALAKPCKVCQSAIEAAGIQVVEFTTGNDNEAT